MAPDEIALLRAWIDQGAEMPGRALALAIDSKPTDPKVEAFLDVIHRRDMAGVRKSLEADKSIASAADSAGSTALMHAAYAGSIDNMRALLDAGADINAKTVEGRTPLHLVAQQPAGAALV